MAPSARGRFFFCISVSCYGIGVSSLQLKMIEERRARECEKQCSFDTGESVVFGENLQACYDAVVRKTMF